MQHTGWKTQSWPNLIKLLFVDYITSILSQLYQSFRDINTFFFIWTNTIKIHYVWLTSNRSYLFQGHMTQCTN